MDFKLGNLGTTFISVVSNAIMRKSNINYDKQKEQIKYLYNPLNKLVLENKRYLDLLKCKEEKFEKYSIEYYKFFLELREVYIKNEVYASSKLRGAFNKLLYMHDLEFCNFTDNDLCDIEFKEEVYKKIAMFELNHFIDENGLSEMERKLEDFIEILELELSSFKYE